MAEMWSAPAAEVAVERPIRRANNCAVDAASVDFLDCWVRREVAGCGVLTAPSNH
jgi:hypothetical protein